MNAMVTPDAHEIMERVIAVGDIAQLSTQERNQFYLLTCQSLGLNPLTRPFDYLRLNGKLVLYAKKDCTDQLRRQHGISVRIVEKGVEGGLYVVTAEAQDKTGRTDADVGAVPIQNLQSEARGNAIMKAITKAKRRVTLSICGLGFLDETEVEDIPAGARQEWEEPGAEAKTQPAPAIGHKAAPAGPPAPPPRASVTITDENGGVLYEGTSYRTAYDHYLAAIDASTDKREVACANLDALRTILPHAKNGKAKRIADDIETAEALVDSYEHERRAIDDADQHDDDGVVIEGGNVQAPPAASGAEAPGPVA
jgi:hypothetical protein